MYTCGVVMEIHGETVWLRPLTRADVDEMVKWGKFTEPDLKWANFEPRNEAEKDFWFAGSMDDYSRRRFAIVTSDNRVIGTLGLRNISRTLSEATLGIRLSAYEVNRGFGTASIILALRLAFGEMNLHRVNLDVAEHNHRARRCYHNIGFRVIGSHIGLDGLKYIDMEISRREFTGRHGRIRSSETGTAREARQDRA